MRFDSMPNSLVNRFSFCCTGAAITETPPTEDTVTVGAGGGDAHATVGTSGMILIFVAVAVVCVAMVAAVVVHKRKRHQAKIIAVAPAAPSDKALAVEVPKDGPVAAAEMGKLRNASPKLRSARAESNSGKNNVIVLHA